MVSGNMRGQCACCYLFAISTSTHRLLLILLCALPKRFLLFYYQTCSKNRRQITEASNRDVKHWFVLTCRFLLVPLDTTSGSFCIFHIRQRLDKETTSVFGWTIIMRKIAHNFANFYRFTSWIRNLHSEVIVEFEFNCLLFLIKFKWPQKIGRKSLFEKIYHLNSF